MIYLSEFTTNHGQRVAIDLCEVVAIMQDTDGILVRLEGHHSVTLADDFDTLRRCVDAAKARFWNGEDR